MNPIAITKLAVGLIASTGVGSLVGTVIKNNLPETTNFLQKVGIYTGSIVLGGIAGDLTKKFVDSRIDSIVLGYRKGKEFGEKFTENLS